MAHQVFEALVPVVVGRVIDEAIAPGDGSALSGWIGGLAVLFLALSYSYRYGARCLERAEQAATHDLVLAVTQRVLDPRGGVGRSAGDLVSGLRVLTGLGAGPAAAERYRRASQESLRAALHSSWPESAHRGLSVAVTGSTLAAVALVGGRSAAEGAISVGDLVAAVGLVGFLIGPLLRLGLAGTEYAAARASGHRVAEVIDAVPAVGAGSLPPPADDSRLEVSGLRYAALHGLDLTLDPGELVGLVTGDPADATALLDVLSRTTEDYTGAVRLGGAELREIELTGLLDTLVVGGPDPYHFEGTVTGNVLARADRSLLEPAMTAAGAEDLARALPGGYDAVVTERGRSLSGGQRQRVALARALATQARVLVLHDPTTAIDAATEARIADGVRRMRAGRSTLLVTSSPALLAATDRVVLVADGAVRSGTHAEFMAGSRDYRWIVTG